MSIPDNEIEDAPPDRPYCVMCDKRHDWWGECEFYDETRSDLEGGA